MSRRLGSQASICRNGNTYNSPSWIALRAAMDIKLNLEPSNVFDASDRGQSVDLSIPTQRFKTSVEFDAIWNGGAGLTALRTAFLAGTSIELAVLDGAAAASSWGVRGEWAVTEFPFEFPLNDGQKLKIKLEPHGNYTNAMAFYTDATSSAGTAESAATRHLGGNASLNDSSNAPITAIQDLKMMIQPSALFDSSDRGATFDTVIPTRFKYGIECSFLWDRSNTQLVAFRTAFLAGSPIQLTALDGAYATVGSWGITGDWAVTGFPIDAKLKDGQKIDLKLVPHGNYTNAPGLVTIS